jgi:rhodanese-related sulfurtransferase
MTVERIGIDRLHELLAKGAQLVDALPAEEYEKLHIAGAVSLPIEDFQRKHVDRLNRSNPIVTYCADTQ